VVCRRARQPGRGSLGLSRAANREQGQPRHTSATGTPARSAAMRT
jgi:hypothetical protein